MLRGVLEDIRFLHTLACATLTHTHTHKHIHIWIRHESGITSLNTVQFIYVKCKSFSDRLKLIKLALLMKQ